MVEQTFTVYLLGFPEAPEDASQRLAKMFNIDEATAASFVHGAPVAVKRSATRETALAVERGLRSIGADVEVRQDGASVRPRPGMRRPAVVSQPPARLPPDVARSTPPPAAAHARVDAPSFWGRIPVAFVVPFLGGGVLWLIALAGMLVVFSLSQMAPCLNIIFLPITGAVYLGLMGTYFGQCVQAGMEDDGTPQPRWSLPNQQDVLYRGGALLVVTLLLFGAAGYLAYTHSPPSWVFAAGLVPYVYWPMALTVSGLTGSLGSLFDPIRIGKGIFAGGIPYALVVAFGYLAYAGLGALPAVVSTAGSSAVIGSLAVIIVGVGYIAGVQGYLMGCLVNARAEKFESLSPAP